MTVEFASLGATRYFEPDRRAVRRASMPIAISWVVLALFFAALAVQLYLRDTLVLATVAAALAVFCLFTCLASSVSIGRRARRAVAVGPRIGFVIDTRLHVGGIATTAPVRAGLGLIRARRGRPQLAYYAIDENDRAVFAVSATGFGEATVREIAETIDVPTRSWEGSVDTRRLRAFLRIASIPSDTRALTLVFQVVVYTAILAFFLDLLLLRLSFSA